jgi:molecular chaperone DnaK (HSP70)
MTRARFSVGIDLGTTNCALAFAPLAGDAGSEVFSIPQWDAPNVIAQAPTLPSFLYLPEEAARGGFQGTKAGPGAWVIGRLARAKAADRPDRVAHSAKSWLGHHAVDRSAPFLPWGSDDVAREEKISPVTASALILGHLRNAWNERFAGAGPDFAFEAQVITIAVPASFDAAAQRLTLAAAAQAGFPETVRLLEEPQAAFYHWLEPPSSAGRLSGGLSKTDGGAQHVLVVDIGGGTSDFSLFEFHSGAASRVPHIKRIAVSDHILLGGDNMDLAIAHRLEPQLAQDGEPLSGGQWAFLVARCRDLKETVLSSGGPPDEAFTLVLPGRGSTLIAGARSARLSRAQIEELVLDGFFPECYADEAPLQKKTAIGEWGLPYAADPAVTRHLAAFLRGRPAVGAVLFNGGALAPSALRERISREIGKWQGGTAPIVLDNPEPDLAVARGAARFGNIVRSGAERIEAGNARAIFLEAHRTTTADTNGRGEPSLVCVFPQNTPSEVTLEITDLALELRINRPVRFSTYYSTRQATNGAGDVVAWNERDFHALPPLETVAKTAGPDDGASIECAVPVHLTSKLNELGLLEVACRSIDPDLRQSWPLEFNLRPRVTNGAAEPARTGVLESATEGPNVEPAALNAARERIATLFGQALNKKDKLTATRLIKSLETILAAPKGEWNVALVRSLWTTLETCMGCRRRSVEHEEAWLILAGFLLRPGFGAALDDLRIDRLWSLRDAGFFFPGKLIKVQEYILWRRVGGGLSRERQESVLEPELAALRQQPSPSPELVLLAGSLERIGHETKTELVNRFIDGASAHASENKHHAHFLAALALLLNRAPLYAGPETVVSPDLVEHAFDVFSRLDWDGPKLRELQTLFLRGARLVNNRSLDVPKSVRNRIADKLERSGVPSGKTIPLRQFVPLERSEQVGLFGESLPPGLILRES